MLKTRRMEWNSNGEINVLGSNEVTSEGSLLYIITLFKTKLRLAWDSKFRADISGPRPVILSSPLFFLVFTLDRLCVTFLLFVI